MLSKRKKIIILASMLVLLVLTGVLNVILGQKAQGANTDGDPVSAATMFEELKTEKELSRNQAILILDSIISNENLSQEERDAAAADKLELNDNMQLETNLEVAIVGLGYDDCIVTIGDNYMNVILQAEDLSDLQKVQLRDTIQQMTEIGVVFNLHCIS